ncbi:unnamed protein product [Phaeothamnion confervicola]
MPVGRDERVHDGADLSIDVQSTWPGQAEYDAAPEQIDLEASGPLGTPHAARNNGGGSMEREGTGGGVHFVAQQQESNMTSTSHHDRGHHIPEPLRKHLMAKQPKEFIYELREDGFSEFRDTTIRDLYDYIQKCIEPYAHMMSMTQRRMSMGSASSSHGAGGSAGGVVVARGGSGGGGNSGGSAGDGVSGTDRIVAGRPVKMLRQPSAGAFLSSLYLHNRDLRKMFSVTSSAEPSIQVRRNVILMNFEVLRAIVLVDRVIILVTAGADSILTEFKKAMIEFEREHYASSELVEFEMRAMEAVMSVSAKWLEQEVKEVHPRVNTIVASMEAPGNAAVSPEANDSFRALKNVVSELETRAKARRRAILQVLEEDEDLALMNLTKMKNDPEAYEMPLKLEVLEDHEEVELLLEAYLQEINSLSNLLEIMRERLLNTESLVMVKLDIARNRLLTANTVFGTATMCIALGTLLTGIFGMNLRSNKENSFWLFCMIGGTAGFLTTVPVFLILWWMRRAGLLF